MNLIEKYCTGATTSLSKKNALTLKKEKPNKKLPHLRLQININTLMPVAQMVIIVTLHRAFAIQHVRARTQPLSVPAKRRVNRTCSRLPLGAAIIRALKCPRATLRLHIHAPRGDGIYDLGLQRDDRQPRG